MQEQHHEMHELHIPPTGVEPTTRDRLVVLQESAAHVRQRLEALRPTVRLLHTSTTVNSGPELEDPFSDMPGLEEMDPADEGVWMNEVILDIDMFGLFEARTVSCSGKAEKENKAPDKV